MIHSSSPIGNGIVYVESSPQQQQQQQQHQRQRFPLNNFPCPPLHQQQQQQQQIIMMNHGTPMDQLQQQQQQRPQDNNNSFQYPAHLAANIADSIHDGVKNMLNTSRLTRSKNNNINGDDSSYGIELFERHDYKPIKVLGTGAFSQVSLVQLMDGRQLACKHLKPSLMQKPQQFQRAATELAYEAHMLAAFDHPNILKIRGWAKNGIASFEEGRHDSFFLLLDVLDETLDQRIDRWNQTCTTTTTHTDNYLHEGNLRYAQQLQTLMEVASALDYVHERGVIFRDLKPDNIGLVKGQAKVLDFGLSRELPSIESYSKAFVMSGKVGTIRYMAPEVVLHLPYNLSADVYSWSMVAWEVLTGQKPYQGWSPELHATYVCRQGLRPDLSTLPEDVQILLQHAWHADPSRRPTMKHVLQQLALILEKHRLHMEEQALQRQRMEIQQRHQWEWQQQHQQQQQNMQFHLNQQALQRQQQQFCQGEEHYDIDLNMSFFDEDFARRKLSSRRRMDDSVGTIETSSLSTDSLGF